jgi:nitrite reductase (cytochrome c-552)
MRLQGADDKMQHPEFETWNSGIHSKACCLRDCHMPYERVGSVKVTNHWIRSPRNINNACQTCHKWSEAELTERVRIFRIKHLKQWLKPSLQ